METKRKIYKILKDYPGLPTGAEVGDYIIYVKTPFLEYSWEVYQPLLRSKEYNIPTIDVENYPEYFKDCGDVKIKIQEL